jgi:hypothetical protein
MSHKRLLREHNHAFTFLVDSYSEHLCTGGLLDILPELAEALCAKANATVTVLCQPPNQPLPSASRELLTACVLDLEMAYAFQSVREHTGDSALSSCYIDAVIFQATGNEASDYPSEMQYRVEGTQACRGIGKYQRAKNHFSVADHDGWLFGKEYSAIATGSALDVALISGIQPLTLLIRIRDGKWLTRYLLTGQLPSDDEQAQLNSTWNKLRADQHRFLAELQGHSGI